MTEQSEREAFEAWARQELPGLVLRYGSMDGGYHAHDTHAIWLAWQAARASSPTYAAGWSAAVEAAAKQCDEWASFIAQVGTDPADTAASIKRASGQAFRDAAIAIRALALPTAATDGDAVERNAAVEIGRAMGREEAAKIVAIEAAKAGALSCEVETKDAKHFANGVASQYRQLAAAIRTAPPADAEALVERVAEAIASKVSVAVPLFQGPIVDGIEAAARAALSALGIGRV